ncbi:hypothetical protein K440DRAFT_307380 [Wilcoxina mikolae CBS 423.85]|nr:hypothetical protein K440DRAFT_307380 [Wilcoxina mikolae CBS 423.85]
MSHDATSSTTPYTHPTSLPLSTATFTPPPSLHFPSTNFVISASTLSFHPPTQRVLIVADTNHNPTHYFLPRGRKDTNESLPAAAVRETFEEAGFRVSLLPSAHQTLQPPPPTPQLHTEAFWIALLPYPARKGILPRNVGGVNMYLAHYFLGVVEDTTRDAEYGKSFTGKHESGYDGRLVGVEDAVGLLSSGRFEVRRRDLVWKGWGEVLEWGMGKRVLEWGIGKRVPV